MSSFNPFYGIDIDVPDLDEIEQRVQETNRRKATAVPTKLGAAPTLSDDIPVTNKHDQTKLLGLFQKKRTQPYISPRKRATTPSEEERTRIHQSLPANKDDDIEEYDEEPPKKKQMYVKQPLGIVKTKFTPPRAAQEKPSQTSHPSRTTEPLVLPTSRATLEPVHIDVDLDDVAEPVPSTIPARRSLFNNNKDQLVSTRALQEPFASVFSWNQFNPVQSKCFPVIMESEVNMVISAPTGSGKTTIFELAIIHQIMKQSEDIRERIPGQVKVIYLAPLKALCQQVAASWKERFGPLGILIKELTGDSDTFDYRELEGVDVILTTPEKFDSITRKWRDHISFMQKIGTLLIDEVQLLNEPRRGNRIEAVVSRMKTLSTSVTDCPAQHMRFIALSATIPNMEDIAEWLGAPTEGVLRFGDEFRPVKLEYKVLGFYPAKNDFLFDKTLNYKLFEVVKTHYNRKSTLIFCSSRKGSMQTAQQLVKDAVNFFVRDRDHYERLVGISRQITDKNLQEYIVRGVGYHCAGLSLEDRRVVEDAFLSEDIPVLCTTQTLAQGVNFPAQLVIIKGTQYYSQGSGFREYDELTLLQMLGRCGRPQFTNTETALAIIMTSTRTKYLYEQMMTHKRNIESHMMEYLTEHLNSEIVLGTIPDTSVAINWVQSTYLMVRIKKNPSYYLSHVTNVNNINIDNELNNIIMSNLQKLTENGMVTSDEDFWSLSATDLGVVMAHYYISFQTMVNFIELKADSTLSDLLTCLSQSSEYSDFHLRIAEKKILNDINKNKESLRFPFKGKIKERDMKVNCLIQAELGNVEVKDPGLKQETFQIMNSCTRIIKAMQQYLKSKGYFTSLCNAINLHQCLASKMWEDSPLVVRQLEKIGPVLARSLVKAGITTFDALERIDPRRIELICNRHPPFGNDILEAVKKLPRYSMDLIQKQVRSDYIEVTINVMRMNYCNVSNYNGIVLVVGNDKNELLFYKRYATMSTPAINVTLTLKPYTNSITATLYNEDYVGLDITKSLTPSSNRIVTIPDEEEVIPSFDVTIEEPLPNPTACKHFCKDKMACKHECCKIGTKRGNKYALVSSNEEIEEDIQLMRNKAVNYANSAPVRRLPAAPINVDSNPNKSKSKQATLNNFFPPSPKQSTIPINSPAPSNTYSNVVPTRNQPVSSSSRTTNTISIPTATTTPTPPPIPVSVTTTRSSPYFSNASNQIPPPQIPYNINSPPIRSSVPSTNILPPSSTSIRPPPIPSRTTPINAPRSQVLQSPTPPPTMTTTSFIHSRPQVVIPIPGGTIPTIQRLQHPIPQPTSTPLPSNPPRQAPKNPFYKPRYVN